MTHSDSSYHHIYIWMPLGVQQFGHASLHLSNGEYISLWPKEVGAKSGLKKKRRFNCCLYGDIAAEAMTPDYMYRISSTQLDLDEMMKSWKKQKDIPLYSLLRQNCCRVVYNVLRAGGAPKSLTIVWRPETLRRYLVIYLGGGSSLKTLLNMPGWDSPLKEKIKMYTWEAKDGNERHFALSLDESVYVSWWPRTSRAAGHAAESLMDDRSTIGRVEDKTYNFPDNGMEYHLMRRRWKQMLEHETSNMWETSSDWVVYWILEAGGIFVHQLENIMKEYGMFETRRRKLSFQYKDYKEGCRRLDVSQLYKANLFGFSVM
ncbi:uncharacterized protein LOC124280128 [Haliotis rubra]|uniref:uncharacterized protein LOC124280128 n=1 Tax=Haliotis rubra TaxID=36100 RepID=UPI001EE53F0A|nr:uncharacterized protein LOC124280128 [Haliotis rubra]XP_046571974.1 uncharacterized protein LOC124280128 [Haliotis rubra]